MLARRRSVARVKARAGLDARYATLRRMPTGTRPRNAIVAYPGTMPAASEVARAFAERGALGRYETTFAYCPDALPDRVLRAGARMVFGARADRELQRRALDGLPAAQVRRRPYWELLRIAVARLGAAVPADRIWERTMRDFDARVAARLSAADGLVYGYEHACRETFARAASLGVFSVFDMAAPHFAVTDRILGEQIAAFPETRKEHWNATRGRAAERNRHKQAEFDLAALIIANSRFTASTLDASSARKVRVVPLGAPAVDPGWRTTPRSAEVQVLFAGSISVRKGAHLLLAAWRALGVKAGAKLSLAGSWLLPREMRAELPAGVELLGGLPRAELYERYRRASVLVLPSLLDGFGMVVTEALAHGLPVITTRNVGAADLIDEGRNGWVIPAGDVTALAERLQRCIEHPNELHAMRELAERSAAQRPWAVYRRELFDAICAAMPS